jgi:WD40 repeat protein
VSKFIISFFLQSCTPLAVDSSSPINSVAFHPDDRFLATAGRKISLFSVQSLSSLGNLSLDIESGQKSFSSIAIAASQPSIAAGTSCGCVAVWDYKTKQQLYIDTSRHIGGTTAVQFAPLDPGVLYSTGKDGALLMQDLRSSGPFHVPTARIGAGVGLTSLSIREDFTYLAAGTVDGRVLLYDPRYCAAPAATLRCGDPAPVTSIHWQHNYQSLTSRAKDAVAHAVAEGTFPTGRLSMAMSVQGEGGDSSGDSYFPTAATATAAATTGDRFASIGGTPTGSATAPVPPQGRGDVQRLSLASSLASHLEPPRKLDLSPIVRLREPHGNAGGNGGGVGEGKNRPVGAPPAAPSTSISEYHAALSRLRRESTATANTVNAPPPPRPPPSVAVAAPVAADAATMVANEVELPPSQAVPAPQSVYTSPFPPLSPLSPLAPPAAAAVVVEAVAPPAASDYSTGEPSWRIKAMTPRRGAALDTDYTDAAGVSSRRNYEPTTANPAAGSPSKIPLAPLEKISAATAPPQLTVEEYQSKSSSGLIDGHALQQDILAMHLDMLTHFKEQEKANAALVAGVVAKQHALEEEVASLRQELRDLLSRRDNTLWL